MLDSQTAQVIDGIAATAQAALTQIDELRARLARGTDDVTEQARAAAATPPLADRIESALRAGLWSLDDLCREVRAPAGPVAKILKRAKEARQVYNVGAEDRPVWTWVIGDVADTQVLYAHVARLIEYRPFELAELQLATGARRGRVSGAIVSFQHGGRKVLNLGTQKHARWMLLPEGKNVVRSRRA